MAKTITINEVNFTALTGQKALDLLNDYARAWHRGDCELWHVYGRCSEAKRRAFDYCIAIMNKVGGRGYYIASYNTCVFTFVYVVDDGDFFYVVKETRDNRYIAHFSKAEYGHLI